MDIAEIAEDIINIKFERTDTIEKCLEKFYNIMRKHGIKQGTPSYNEDGVEAGRICDNYEWTICKQLFLNQFKSFIELESFFNGVPKDLLK